MTTALEQAVCSKINSDWAISFPLFFRFFFIPAHSAQCTFDLPVLYLGQKLVGVLSRGRDANQIDGDLDMFIVYDKLSNEKVFPNTDIFLDTRNLAYYNDS